MLRAIFGGRKDASTSEQSRAIIPTGTEVFMIGPDGTMATLRGKTTSSGSSWVPTGVQGRRALDLQTSDTGRTLAYSASVWAFRCANIRAGKVAEQLQNAQLYNKDTDQVVSDGPYQEAIAYAYKRYFQEFYFDLTINSYIYGEAFVEKMPLVMDIGIGQEIVAGPGGMRVLPSVAVEPYIPYGDIEGYDFLGDDGTMVRFKPDEIAYYKLFNPADTLRGFSMMDVAMESVNVDMYVVRFAKKYYENGARPGIVFTPKELDLDDSDLESIKNALRREVKGVDNWHKPLFLTRALDATLYPSPEMEDQGYLTDESRERIASAFSVPVGMITFGNARYQFSPELRKSFYEETVIPDVKRYVRWLNAHMLPFFYPNGDHELRYSGDGVITLLGEQAQRITMVNEKFDQGAITFNERRLELGYTPIENGNFYSLPAGRVYLSSEEMQQLVGGMAQPNLLGGLSQGAGTPSFTINSTGQQHDADESKTASPGSTKTSLPSDADFQAPPQDDVLDELRAWEKKTLNGGPRKALDFVCYHTPGAVQESVRSELKLLDDEASQSDIRTLFSTIRDEIEAKAIQATRIEFELEMEALLLSARAENGIDRRTLANRLRTAIRKFGEMAYRDGLESGGVEKPEDEPLDPEDLAEVNRLAAEQSGFVTNFGAEVFDKKALSDGQAQRRPAMWYRKSIHPFFMAGLASADKNGMYEWQLGQTEEHCSDCLRLNGQRHRLRDWYRKNLIPRSDKLECGGFECDCRLVKVQGRAQGSF